MPMSISLMYIYIYILCNGVIQTENNQKSFPNNIIIINNKQAKKKIEL